jgi:hypothetical protein
MADLATASVAAEEGVGGGTHENDTGAWARYTQYCNSIGLNDNYFLNKMPRQHKPAIMGAFAVAIREGLILTSPATELRQQSQNSQQPHIFGQCDRANIQKFPEQKNVKQSSSAFTTSSSSKTATSSTTPWLDWI